MSQIAEVDYFFNKYFAGNLLRDEFLKLSYCYKN